MIPGFFDTHEIKFHLNLIPIFSIYLELSISAFFSHVPTVQKLQRLFSYMNLKSNQICSGLVPSRVSSTVIPFARRANLVRSLHFSHLRFGADVGSFSHKGSMPRGVFLL